MEDGPIVLRKENESKVVFIGTFQSLNNLGYFRQNSNRKVCSVLFHQNMGDHLWNWRTLTGRTSSTGNYHSIFMNLLVA